MRGLSIARSGAAWAAVWTLCSVAALNAQTPPPPLTTTTPVPASTVTGETVPVVAPRSDLELAERFAKVLQFNAPIARVDGFDPSVVSVTPIGQNLLRVQALDQGVTTIIFTDADGKSYHVEVYVVGDARLLHSVLKRQFPNTAITVTKVRDSVLLRGWVSEPQHIPQIVEIAELYFPRVLNQMSVGGPQEVQLRVQVMEVQRSLIRRFGFNFAAIGDNVALSSTPGPLTPLSTLTLPFGGPPGMQLAQAGLADTSMALGIATDHFVFQGLLQALKEEGLLKIQAEPVLVTRSGEAARLINGGEFPIPVPQSLGTVTIEWREFGVTLESLPTVLGPTTLKQQIKAEVSERDFTTAVTLNGTTVPGLTKRTVETQAVMEFGQTLVIGGLISTRHTAETDKLPFLGELPGIGAAFRRTRYDTAETELLVLITPEYVTALSPDQMPPGGPGKGTDAPTDRELYWQGQMEVPNYGNTRCQGPNCQPATMPYGEPLAPLPMPYPPAIPGSPAYPPPASLPLDPSEPGLIAPPGILPPPAADPATSAVQKPKNASTGVAASRPMPRTTNRALPASAPRPRSFAGETYPDDGLIEPAGFKQPAP
ncbi:MAG: pilus assembly protein N-terminal domain-containing protein [Planctomycetaceae bacterium]|nr:pilus assembly protein N-terminal domain-containing protein [Planctomycetaceae bacterium]